MENEISAGIYIITTLFLIIFLLNGGVNNIILSLDSDYNKEIVGNNITNSSFNFQFTKSIIKNCYSNLEKHKCFINLYINEFKNNNTIKELKSINFNNNNYYINNEYSYKMSFIIDKQDFNFSLFSLYYTDNQNIVFNKTTDLIIDKIEIEYYGTKYNLNFILAIYFIYLMIILSFIFAIFQNL